MDGGTKWVFEPIMFREVDAVPTPREILVPEPGADDADETFVDESVELSAPSQNVNVWLFVVTNSGRTYSLRTTSPR